MAYNDDRRGDRRGGGKPPPTSGISPTEAKDLRERLSALSSRVDSLEKFLKEHFAEKNQWNSTVREWVGKQVVVELLVGGSLMGELLWLDRYTICVSVSGVTKIVHKAAIVLIYRADA